MNKGRDSIEADFGRLLLPLARRWRQEADRAMARLGLSHASGWVLLHVGRLGDGVRQSDLAAALDMRGSSLVPQVDRLEKAGLVLRELEDGDRRINRILLTAPGRALVGRIEDALRAIRGTLFEGVDDTALETMNHVLAMVDARLIARREDAR